MTRSSFARIARPLFTTVGLVASLTACPGGGLSARDPVESCVDVCEAACASFVSNCQAEEPDSDALETACVSDCSAGSRCEDAVELGDNYDECLEAVDSDTCRDPGAGQMPAVCQGAFFVRG